ncbi:class I SAM-dependent methyltransferase [Coralliovum pocilloporae]|uniref:class I SAM-dependent methyltransferase n=1 Tax=Coralliovum pocilloporae TaxID=3066369 RepID=UPI0033073096
MTIFSDANLKNWDNRALIHKKDTTGLYRIDKVMAGGSCLHALEADEIGDIAGKSVVHLQCHIGLDTLSLAHLGATVTGVDFSSESIKAARDFAAEAGTEARFVQSDVYNADTALGGQTFDMVYVSWGALNWLPDIDGWARVVSAVLKPGGIVYLAEAHPSFMVLDEENGRLVAKYDWRTSVDGPLEWDEDYSYAGDGQPLTHRRCYEWNHPLSDVLAALSRHGLGLQWLHEHDTLTWKHVPMMVEVGEDQFGLPEGQPRLPLSYSLKAIKMA